MVHTAHRPYFEDSGVGVLSSLLSFYMELSAPALVAFLALQVGLLPAGRVFAAATEWTVHRYIFHALGKRKGSRFSFHWRQHHRSCRKVEMVDDAYVYGSLFEGSNGRAREVWSIVVGCLFMVPALPYVPGLVLGAWYGGWRYHWSHRQCHLDPEWGKENMRWHYDHHMGPNPDTNWGVSNEWFDKWMGTRSPWEGPKRRNARNDSEQAAK
jgi:hypothetical protein